MMSSTITLCFLLLSSGVLHVYGSCVGRCNDPLDNTKPCQCNSHCVQYNDCCDDYHDVCGQGSLSSLADTLWNLDVNRLVADTDYVINYQGQVNENNKYDNAPLPFFTSLNENKVDSITSYVQFKSLLDNYESTIGQAEDLTSQEWGEIDAFLDTVMASGVMQEAFKYLHENGHVPNDAAQFREKLKEMWFNLYPRSSGGVIESSGFEHVLVGEHRSTVSGFHNWLQFFLQEDAGRLDYQGFVKTGEPRIVGSQFDWVGYWKSLGSFFLGTSPEFDMSLYSVCAIMHPNAVCSFHMNGSDVRIQTWDIGHKTGLQIASAYPIL
ncbi:poly(U)-specific endoribonuclease-like [Gigantopelta aegis]|uniref:poly(U)-specific endoribonuclease-like n=1 Tax=Gigantopelta aegis TaxID=1735272 RepID=UPI001B88AEEB|nr:poly(U)-specific endoribonuclease-like [Gigantopelta aegis]